jgi:hypothetical protein
LLLSFALGAVAAPASAQSLQVIGYSGYLGEWELTATVTEKARLWAKEFSGPLSMKHVGICTQDGPEEKTGEIRFQISALSSQHCWSKARRAPTAHARQTPIAV